MSDVGYPRIERNANDEPIINIGPYGHLSVAAAMLYPYLPKQWPSDWPGEGVIALDDPRVGNAISNSDSQALTERELLDYYSRVIPEGFEENS